MSRLVNVRRSLSYANVVASLALFVALGGSSYAAVAITGKDVRDGSLTGADIRNHSLTAADVKPGSLLASDFKPGQLRGVVGGASTWTYHQDVGGANRISDLPALPGLAQATIVCGPDNDGTGFLYLHNAGASKLDLVADLHSTGDANPDQLLQRPVDAGGVTSFRLAPGISQLTLQLSPAAVTDPGPVATMTASYVGAPQRCDLTAAASYEDPGPGG